MEEMFDIYDINGNHLGIKPKSFCHSKNPGVYHKPVWIWIVNDEGKILVQKRASTKKFMPSKWDGPATGHVHAGEKSIDACIRETREELGIKTTKEDFVFLKEWLAQVVWELGQVYISRQNKKISEMHFEDGEVDEVAWLTKAEFKKLLFSDEFMPYDEDYKIWVFDTITNFKFEKVKE